jgi:TrmH family RNA methyltransferase
MNIGAAARAMANFGFQRLSIVAPFAVNWMEAKSAVGAPGLLRDAKVYETLAEAVSHCTLVLGTGSLDRRKPEQAILDLPEAGRLVKQALTAEASVSRIALLFGSEKHGLTSDDLSWCHALVVIETSDAQPSMNLGQAVAVCLYEFSRTTPETASQTNTPAHEIRSSNGQSSQLDEENPSGSLVKGHDFSHADKLNRIDRILAPGLSSLTSNQLRQQSENPDSGQLDRLAGLIEETMEAVNYTTRGMRSANGEALRVLLHRLMPSETDLRRMMGLFRRILWQLRRPGGGA